MFDATHITKSIQDQAYAVQAAVLSPSLCASWRQLAKLWQEEGRFHPAAIGQGGERQRREDIRGDHIAWLVPEQIPASATIAWQAVTQVLSAIQLSLNRTCYLGIDDFECHLARYPAGSFYRRHVDRFRTDDRRVLSFIFYLNADWQPQDGGALHVYDPQNPTQSLAEVLPCEGTLVCFLSENVPHEVAVTQRERLSLTGWMRRRPSP